MASTEQISKKIDFMYSFRPIYYISRVCGRMPFTIACNANGEIQEPKITKCDRCWLLISTFIYLLIAYPTVYIMWTSTRNKEYNIFYLGEHFFKAIILIFGLLQMALDFFNRFQFVKILKSFTAFDRKVN